MERDRSLADIFTGVLIGSVIGLFCALIVILLLEQPDIVIEPKFNLSTLLSLIVTTMVGLYIATSINRQNIEFAADLSRLNTEFAASLNRQNTEFSAKLADAFSRKQGVIKAQRDKLNEYCEEVSAALEKFHLNDVKDFYDTALKKINNNIVPGPSISKADLLMIFLDNVDRKFSKLRDALVGYDLLKYDEDKKIIIVEHSNPVYNGYTDANELIGSYYKSLFSQDGDIEGVSEIQFHVVRKNNKDIYNALDGRIMMLNLLINKQDSFS